MSFIVNDPSNAATSEKSRRTLMLNHYDYTTTRDFIYTSPYEIYAERTYAGPTYAGPITVTPSKNSFPLNAEPSKCYRLCPCYKKDSADSRCCGFCYHFYPPKKSNNIHCEICPNGFFDHCRSGYIYTDDTGCNNEDDDNTAGCYCIICFPFKLVIFSPCLLGLSLIHI